jgi:hypothetical protein
MIRKLILSTVLAAGTLTGLALTPGTASAHPPGYGYGYGKPGYGYGNPGNRYGNYYGPYRGNPGYGYGGYRPVYPAPYRPYYPAIPYGSPYGGFGYQPGFSLGFTIIR